MGGVKVELAKRVYVALKGGREVEVPGLYALKARRGYVLVVADIALTPQGLVDYVAKLEGRLEDAAAWALRGALAGSITDEAWEWALSALERGEAKVVVK
ncbi:MAG: hypothetical protein LM580_05635 [Thermofilum sp.]|nr:hypothetical protein [Thermofilum sp.]